MSTDNATAPSEAAASRTTTAEPAAPGGVGAANPADTHLWVERTGIRQFTGRSSRGGEVLIGSIHDEGRFTPGELLKLALAGCSGLSADSPLRRRLGDDVPVTIHVEAPTHETEDRYPAFREELVVDLSGLDPEARERLLTVVHRAVEEHCTVGRTLEAGATVQLTVTGDR